MKRSVINKYRCNLRRFFQYFQALAKPDNDPSFDQTHKEQVDKEFLIIQNITYNDKKQTLKITKEEVTKAIKGLNRGKSPNILGIFNQKAGDAY